MRLCGPVVAWNFEHDPEARPIGCNGRYGRSGESKHLHHGEKACEDCLASRRHYERERRRGQKYPRALRPCGTKAAAERHRNNGEEIDLACRLAEADSSARAREKRRQRARERGNVAA